MKKKYLGIFFIVLSVLLAMFYLVKFDRLMAHTTSWTDGQAESWTIFSQGLDAIILGLIIVFISVGTFLSLRLKRKWLNFLIAVVAGLITWLIFYLIQLSLQQHFSRFSGV